MASELRVLTAELDRELIHEHRHNGELFARLTELQQASGLMHGSRPISPFLRPYFLERSRYDKVCRAAHTLSRCFEKLTAAALDEPAVMQKLGLTDDEEQAARLDPRYKSVSVTSRLDTFLYGDGFKFLEYNGETPAGVGDQPALRSLYENVPEVLEFLKRHPHYFPQPHERLIEALERSYREFGGKRPVPGIAIVDWTGVDTAAEFEILRGYFESRGFPTRICDPGELEYDGEVLRYGSFEIDILYKRVLIHELLERADRSHPVFRAVSDAAVCMANSFRSKIPHKKASFSILSDPDFHRLFSTAELQTIRRHIPWTRNVEDDESTHEGDSVDLLKFIRAKRHRLLLKPNDDYGGRGIVIGWESTETDWDDAIEMALEAPYVVQERAEVELTDIPVFAEGEATLGTLTVDLDPYLFMGEVEGGMVRLAEGSLVNVTQGGGETALVILEEF